MKKVLFSFIILIFVSGCYNYNELNDYSIVHGMGIDYQNNLYTVSVLMPNLESENKKNIVYSAQGKSIYEALNNINLLTPKKIYTGHLSFLIISEKSAKKGLYNILNPLLQDHQINKNFYIVLTKDTTSKKILKNTQAQYITNNIETAIYNKSYIVSVDFNSLLSTLLDNKNPVINGYSLTKDKQNIKLNNLGYFKKDKLIDWATEDESTGINLINNHSTHTTININCEQGNIIANLSNLKRKIKINKQNVYLTIKGTASIKENSCLIDNNNVKKIINKQIKTYINKAIFLSQNKNIDLFGIKQLYTQQKNKTNFNYKQINFITKVKIKHGKISKQNIERTSHEKNN